MIPTRGIFSDKLFLQQQDSIVKIIILILEINNGAFFKIGFVFVFHKICNIIRAPFNV